MKLRDIFDDNGRFEGDRLLHWRSIPANARIVSARATVRPVEVLTGSAFAESLSFNGVGEFGATKTKGSLGAVTSSWIEIDFHTRRTLARLAGNFLNATLQVDVGGGTYVEINRAGAFRTPSDTSPAHLFPISGPSIILPALKVAKFKISNTDTSGNVEPVITSISVISVPTNVSLRVGDLSPFFNHPGEMTQAVS
jgi:hypothetical protein